jgi:hypothetical protein
MDMPLLSEGAIMMTIVLQRDLRGRVTRLGTPDAPERFTSYGFRPDGTIANETLAEGALPRLRTRDGLRRLARLDDPAFTLSLGYRVDGGERGPDADGRITREATSWLAAAFGDWKPASDSRTHDYDEFGRLTAVESEKRPAQALVQRYDADGNISLRASGGAAASNYRYLAGKNWLDAVAPPSGANLTLTHAADGAVSRLGDKVLRHDSSSGRVSSIRTATARLAYQRNASGERVLKVVSGKGATRRLTLRNGAMALADIQSDGSRESYVHGADGIIALIIDGEDHAVSRTCAARFARCGRREGWRHNSTTWRSAISMLPIRWRRALSPSAFAAATLGRNGRRR